MISGWEWYFRDADSCPATFFSPLDMILIPPQIWLSDFIVCTNIALVITTGVLFPTFSVCLPLFLQRGVASNQPCYLFPVFFAPSSDVFFLIVDLFLSPLIADQMNEHQISNLVLFCCQNSYEWHHLVSEFLVLGFRR